ncbi:hypothetical protein NADFUDRAFT_65507 [Nadsonia fulvescens var. elongata DSM 6958]|uniref:HCP-like protein n=1 Tax=Nadsonia fulvescens var. elongata DSM 6958 TaxID=857566 RepID=A0A1E3PJJ6_9ASCO|nr:hypothetical protein NADFUDRAFT_65507 [Nadsonia fulvescens var. elongata DSM 6958]
MNINTGGSSVRNIAGSNITEAKVKSRNIIQTNLEFRFPDHLFPELDQQLCRFYSNNLLPLSPRAKLTRLIKDFHHRVVPSQLVQAKYPDFYTTRIDEKCNPTFDFIWARELLHFVDLHGYCYDLGMSDEIINMAKNIIVSLYKQGHRHYKSSNNKPSIDKNDTSLSAPVDKKTYSRSLHIIGQWYLHGSLNITQDLTKAIQFFTQSAKLGGARSYYQLGIEFELVKESVLALKYYRLGASEKYHDAACHYRLAIAYLRGGQLGLSSTGNLNLGLEHLCQAVKSSDTDCAQPAYLYGLIQLGEALHIAAPNRKYIMKPPFSRHNQSQREGPVSSKLRSYGKGNPPNLRQCGIKAIEYAAWLGFPLAMIRMGKAWQNGECGFNPMISLTYFYSAARQQQFQNWQSIKSSNDDSNRPVPSISKDNEANGVAELEIAKWFLSGDYNDENSELQINEEWAYKFTLMAAKLNNEVAEFAMGYYFEVGIYVVADIDQAQFWYVKASHNGSEDATRRLQEIQLLKKQSSSNITSGSQPSQAEVKTYSALLPPGTPINDRCNHDRMMELKRQKTRNLRQKYTDGLKALDNNKESKDSKKSEANEAAHNTSVIQVIQEINSSKCANDNLEDVCAYYESYPDVLPALAQFGITLEATHIIENNDFASDILQPSSSSFSIQELYQPVVEDEISKSPVQLPSDMTTRVNGENDLSLAQEMILIEKLGTLTTNDAVGDCIDNNKTQRLNSIRNSSDIINFPNNITSGEMPNQVVKSDKIAVNASAVNVPTTVVFTNSIEAKTHKVIQPTRHSEINDTTLPDLNSKILLETQKQLQQLKDQQELQKQQLEQLQKLQVQQQESRLKLEKNKFNNKSDKQDLENNPLHNFSKENELASRELLAPSNTGEATKDNKTSVRARATFFEEQAKLLQNPQNQSTLRLRRFRSTASSPIKLWLEIEEEELQNSKINQMNEIFRMQRRMERMERMERIRARRAAELGETDTAYLDSDYSLENDHSMSYDYSFDENESFIYAAGKENNSENKAVVPTNDFLNELNDNSTVSNKDSAIQDHDNSNQPTPKLFLDKKFALLGTTPALPLPPKNVNPALISQGLAKTFSIVASKDNGKQIDASDADRLITEKEPKASGEFIAIPASGNEEIKNSDVTDKNKTEENVSLQDLSTIQFSNGVDTNSDQPEGINGASSKLTTKEIVSEQPVAIMKIIPQPETAHSEVVYQKSAKNEITRLEKKAPISPQALEDKGFLGTFDVDASKDSIYNLQEKELKHTKESKSGEHKDSSPIINTESLLEYSSTGEENPLIIKTNQYGIEEGNFARFVNKLPHEKITVLNFFESTVSVEKNIEFSPFNEGIKKPAPPIEENPKIIGSKECSVFSIGIDPSSDQTLTEIIQPSREDVSNIKINENPSQSSPEMVAADDTEPNHNDAIQAPSGSDKSSSDKPHNSLYRTQHIKNTNLLRCDLSPSEKSLVEKDNAKEKLNCSLDNLISSKDCNDDGEIESFTQLPKSCTLPEKSNDSLSETNFIQDNNQKIQKIDFKISKTISLTENLCNISEDIQTFPNIYDNKAETRSDESDWVDETDWADEDESHFNGDSSTVSENTDKSFTPILSDTALCLDVSDPSESSTENTLSERNINDNLQGSDSPDILNQHSVLTSNLNKSKWSSDSSPKKDRKLKSNRKYSIINGAVTPSPDELYSVDDLSNSFGKPSIPLKNTEHKSLFYSSQNSYVDAAQDNSYRESDKSHENSNPVISTLSKSSISLPVASNYRLKKLPGLPSSKESISNSEEDAPLTDVNKGPYKPEVILGSTKLIHPRSAPVSARSSITSHHSLLSPVSPPKFTSRVSANTMNSPSRSLTSNISLSVVPTIYSSNEKFITNPNSGTSSLFDFTSDCSVDSAFFGKSKRKKDEGLQYEKYLPMGMSVKYVGSDIPKTLPKLSKPNKLTKLHLPKQCLSQPKLAPSFDNSFGNSAQTSQYNNLNVLQGDAGMNISYQPDSESPADLAPQRLGLRSPSAKIPGKSLINSIPEKSGSFVNIKPLISPISPGAKNHNPHHESSGLTSKPRPQMRAINSNERYQYAISQSQSNPQLHSWCADRRNQPNISSTSSSFSSNSSPERCQQHAVPKAHSNPNLRVRSPEKIHQFSNSYSWNPQLNIQMRNGSPERQQFISLSSQPDIQLKSKNSDRNFLHTDSYSSQSSFQRNNQYSSDGLQSVHNNFTADGDGHRKILSNESNLPRYHNKSRNRSPLRSSFNSPDELDMTNKSLYPVVDMRPSQD